MVLKLRTNTVSGLCHGYVITVALSILVGFLSWSPLLEYRKRPFVQVFD